MRAGLEKDVGLGSVACGCELSPQSAALRDNLGEKARGPFVLLPKGFMCQASTLPQEGSRRVS